MPDPPLWSAPPHNQPVNSSAAQIGEDTHLRNRSGSEPSHDRRGLPMRIADQSARKHLSTLTESSASRDVLIRVSPEVAEVSELSPQGHRPSKVHQLTGSEDALRFHAAVQAQANLPWYLRPTISDQLTLGPNGGVRWGTLPALVERLSQDSLCKDPISASQSLLLEPL